ncbi:MAG: zinc ribbon domain-containing protein [Gammaproteobacteria bacterium]|nr:zinc ribbon domain-containing protein [Gammaproteobacteria bacterium]
MPVYDYCCDANGQTVEVRHGVDIELTTWGEVCYAAQIALGETDFLTPVRKLISAPAIAIPISNSKLKGMGFTKLVKRDSGVYENVTRTGGEARYMQAGDARSLPHLNKKISD